jgi:Skp family chaperone for outer membrane proteins
LGVVRERNAAVILDRRNVFLSAESVDITQEAIERIDAQLGDGTGAEGTDE